MKRTSKTIASVLLVALVLVASIVPASAVSSVAIDYVAFGDSVASGVRGGFQETASAYGYTDLLAADLKAAGALGSFNEDFCTSGMTAKLLATNTAVLKDTTSSSYLLVKNAEVATLDIGGNDLLAPLYTYFKTASTTSLDMAKVKEALTVVANSVYDGTTASGIEANIETILHNILSANPNIKIYVMGYYNPLPVAASLTGVDLNKPLKDFNVYIQKAINDVKAADTDASITYVDTMAAMAADSSNNLVMTDIHPTAAGYKAIAAEFWKQIGLLVPSTTPVTASPTKSSVIVNGKSVAFDAYNINGSNYFKLRDIAKIISGTGKQFEINIDATKSTISLTSGKAYSPVGGELTTSTNTASVSTSLSSWTVYLDGKEVKLTAYLINGNNYFKLRDMGSAVNFGVSFSSSTNTISIDTSSSYTA